MEGSLGISTECTSSGATCKPHRNPTHKQHHELSTWGRIPKANTSEHAGCLEKQTSLSPSGRKGGWRHPVTHYLETSCLPQPRITSSRHTRTALAYHCPLRNSPADADATAEKFQGDAHTPMHAGGGAA